jgi:hypothetical protein
VLTVNWFPLAGYLRGGPLSANDLVHLPDFGDFQMSQIDGTPDPQPFSTRLPKEGMETEGEGAQRRETLEILDMADPDKQVLVPLFSFRRRCARTGNASVNPPPTYAYMAMGLGDKRHYLID